MASRIFTDWWFHGPGNLPVLRIALISNIVVEVSKVTAVGVAEIVEVICGKSEHDSKHVSACSGVELPETGFYMPNHFRSWH